VLFSTHILSDVELICDRVAIVVGGRMRDVGPLKQLLSPRLLHTEVVLDKDGVVEPLRLAPDADVDGALREALAAGKKVVSVTPRRESLEDLFVREVDAADVAGGAERVKLRERT
jgi:ABC-2 type transport system ATP-binding protein